MHSHRILWHLLLWIVWPSCWACAQALSDAEFLKQFEQHLQANLKEDATLKRWEEAEFWLEDQQDDENLWKRYDAAIAQAYPLPDGSAAAADWMQAAMVQALRDDVKQAKHCYQEACKLAEPTSITPALLAFALTDDEVWAAEMMPKVPASSWLDSPQLFRRLVRTLKPPAVVEKLLLNTLESTYQSSTPLLKAKRCLAMVDSLDSWESVLGRTKELVAVLELYIDCLPVDSPEISPIAQAAFVLMVDVATELDPKTKPDRYLSQAWKIAETLQVAKYKAPSELTEVMDDIGVPILSREGISVDDYLIRATLYSKPEAEKTDRILNYLATTTADGSAHPLRWILKQRDAKLADFAKTAANYLTDPVEQKPFQDFPAGLQQLVLLSQWNGKLAENAARLDALFQATETMAREAPLNLQRWCELRWRTFSKLPADQPAVTAWLEGYAKRCSNRDIKLNSEWQSGSDPFDETSKFGGFQDEFSLFWSFAVKDFESALRFGPVFKRLSYQYGLPYHVMLTPSLLSSRETLTAARWHELLATSTLWACSADFEDGGFFGNGPSSFIYCVEAAFKAGLRAPKVMPKGGLPLGRAVFYACMEAEPMDRVLELMLVRQKELLQAPFKCHAALTGILQQLEMQAFSLGPRTPLRSELESLMVVYRAMASLQPEEMLRNYAVVTQPKPVKRYGSDLSSSLLPLAWRVCPKWFWGYLELYHSRLFAIRQDGPLDELGQGYAWQFEADLREVFSNPFWAGPWYPSKSEFVHLIKFMSDVVADGTLPHFDARNRFLLANWLEIMKNGRHRVDWKDLVKSVGSAIPQRDLPLILRPLLDLIDQECRTEYGTVGFALHETAWMESAVKEKSSHAWLAQSLLDGVVLRRALMNSCPGVNPLIRFFDSYFTPLLLPPVVDEPSRELRAARLRFFNINFKPGLPVESLVFYHGDLLEWAGPHVGENFILRAGELLGSLPPELDNDLPYTIEYEIPTAVEQIVRPLLSMVQTGTGKSVPLAANRLSLILQRRRNGDRLISEDQFLDIALVLGDEATVAELWPKERPTASLLIRLLRTNRLAEARQLWRTQEAALFDISSGSHGFHESWWRGSDPIPSMGSFLSGLPEEERVALEILILLDRGYALDSAWVQDGLNLERLKVLVGQFNANKEQKSERQLLLTEFLLGNALTREWVDASQIERALQSLPEFVGPPAYRGKLEEVVILEQEKITSRRNLLERRSVRVKALTGDWMPYQQAMQREVVTLARARTVVKHVPLKEPLPKWELPRNYMTYRAFDDTEFDSPFAWWMEFTEILLRRWPHTDDVTRRQLRGMMRELIFNEESSICFDPWTFFALGTERHDPDDLLRDPNVIARPDTDAFRLLLVVFLHAIDDAGIEFAQVFQRLSPARQKYLQRIGETLSWQRSVRFIRLNFPWQTIKHRLTEPGGVMDRFFEIFPAKLIDHSEAAKLPAEWQAIASEWSLTPSEFLEWIKR